MNTKSTTTSDTYLVVASKRWNRRLYDEEICHYPGEWHFVHTIEELTADYLNALNPRKIFFLHWSWKVPAEIIEHHECICFHMTDVPYGRGGSPLQNLIARGHKSTKLSALRMVWELDAGPVYMKEDLDLSGSAEEIFIRASQLAASMIRIIIEDDPKTHPQEGEVVLFARRKPEQSRIPTNAHLEGIYDQIRMLDAEGYPKAFIEQNNQRYEFSRARLIDGKLVANVSITIKE